MKVVVLSVLTAAALTVAPATARAQLVDITDPCYIALFGMGAKNILSTGNAGNKTHLEDGVLAIRTSVSGMLTLVQDLLKDGTVLTPAQLEGLRAKNRCLPWLERQLGLLVGQLKRMGAQDIALPNERQHVPIDQFQKDVVEALKEAERKLAQVLKVR